MSTCCRILRMVFMNEASFYRYVSFYLTKYALGIQRCAQYTLKMHFFNRIVTLLRQSISECQFAFFFRLFQNYILCIRCMCSLLLLLSAAFMPFIGKQCKMCEFLSTFVAVIIFYYCKWFYPAKHVKCIVRAIVHTFKYSSTVAKIAIKYSPRCEIVLTLKPITTNQWNAGNWSKGTRETHFTCTFFSLRRLWCWEGNFNASLHFITFYNAKTMCLLQRCQKFHFLLPHTCEKSLEL